MPVSLRTFNLFSIAQILLICLGSGFPCVEANASPKADFYVSPDGDDLGPGTSDAPFSTLNRARDAVRELKRSKKDGDILVYIKGGRYLLKETIVFKMEDSGAENQKIQYVAYPGEQPVFTSELNIAGWRKLQADEYPENLPEEARGKIWITDLPKELGCFKTMYNGDELLPRAKRGFDPTLSLKDISFHGEYQHKLLFPDESLKNWSNLEDVEISLVPRARWQHNYLGLKEVDEVNKIAYPMVMATYQMSESPQRSPSVFVENVIEALDQPGEWVVNTETGKIYFWPETGNPGSDINVPVLREFIRIEGDIDFDGPIDKPVTDIIFKGLTFTKGERYTLKEGDAGTHSDWGIYDKDNALFRLRGAERVIVEECRFIYSGENAIRLDLYCQNNSIRNNSISYMGRSGVVLCGYGPGTKYVNKNNEVINNHIHHLGKLHWNGIGIYISMSGENRISHNLIHDTPFNGIAITGAKHWLLDDKNEREAVAVRWEEIETDDIFTPEKLRPYIYTIDNVVEYNEIHHPMLELGDGNCIYLNTSGKGNIIRNNYVHHLGGENTGYAIRTDDHVIETRIYNNIVEQTTGGILLKQTNDIYNNYVINTVQTNPMGPYADILIKKGPVDHAVIKRNICYTDKSRSTFVVANGNLPEQVLFQQADLDYNLFYSADANDSLSDQYTDYLYANREQQGENSLYADPEFYPLGNRDFRLKPESPAFKLGIEAIDASEIGLLADFAFADATENLERLFIKTSQGNTSVLRLASGERGELNLIARTETGYIDDLSNFEIIFKSLNNKVAAVDGKGTVTAKIKGETLVEAQVKKNKIIRTIQIAIIVD